MKRKALEANSSRKGRVKLAASPASPISEGRIKSDQFEFFRVNLSPSRDSRAIEALLAIRSTAHLIESKLAAWIAPEGISLGHFNVLISLLGTKDQMRTMSELARTLVASPANATKLVTQLEEAGFVKREVDPRDKRGVVVRLTKKGEHRIKEIAPAQIARVEAAMHAVPRWVCESLTEHLNQVLLGFKAAPKRRQT